MAQVSRTDKPPRNPQYPQGASNSPAEQDAPERRFVGELPYPPGRSLARGDIYGTPFGADSARTIGRGIGITVAQVRQMPRRVDMARSRLHEQVGRRRADLAARLLEMMDAAAYRTARLRSAARHHVALMADRASLRTTVLGERAAERVQELSRVSQQRLQDARRRAQVRWQQGRQTLEELRRDDPVRFLTVVAGGAFVLGAALRVWRTRRD
jgi:hypothetical protein